MTEPLTDDAIVDRVLAGERATFELLMRRHNQRLFRAARAIVKDDNEAEDVVQEAYLNAYAHLGAFEGRASVATWLTRIVVHGALARVRKSKRFEPMDDEDPADHNPVDPEQITASRELAGVLEEAIDRLPDSFRVVFMMRAVEEMTVADTAACLDIPEETVKTRLFRARALLGRELEARADASLRGVHRFLAERCDRLVAGVFARLPRE